MEKKLAAWLDSLEGTKREYILSTKSTQEKQYAIRYLTGNERDEVFSIVLSEEEKASCNEFIDLTDRCSLGLRGAVLSGNARLADQLLQVMVLSDMLIHHQLLLDAERLIRVKKHKKGRPRKDDSALNYLVQIKAGIGGSTFSATWTSTFESLTPNDGKKMKARPPIDTSMGTPMEVAIALVDVFDGYGVPSKSSLGTWLDRLGLTVEDIKGYIEKNNV